MEGLPFAYRQTTPRAGVPVLFLHGLGDNADTWAPIVDSLADTGLADTWSIALDQRGHGDSPRLAGYELGTMVADVAGFLDALRVPRADLVGHSMGAMVSYLFATRHPERVRRLVLEEPPPPEPADPPRDEGPRPDRELGYDWAIQAPFSRQRNNPDPAWRDGLAGITAATLIMSGTESHLPADATRRMTERIPTCRQLSFAAGHEVHDAVPAEFTQALVAFLAEPAR